MIWDASDANPMHRRIPAEVVSRRRPEQLRKKPTAPKEKEIEPEEVIIDLKAAIGLKPEGRPTWLRKAIKMVQDGKGSSTELYNIVVSRKFAAGLPERVARKLIDIVKDKDTHKLFSDKQRRYLSSEDCPLLASRKREEQEAEPEEKEEKADDKEKADEDAADAADKAEKSEVDRKTEKAEDEPAGKTKLLIEQRAARSFDSLREERQRDRDAERARDREEREKERERTRKDSSAVPSSGSTAGTSKWQTAVDEAAQRRQVIKFGEDRTKESARKFEKHRLSALEPEAATKKEDPAATRRKQEEEADDLMNAILGGGGGAPPPQQPPPVAPATGNARRRDRDRAISRSISAKRPRRSRSGSRSISSRTARRLARNTKPKPRNDGRGDWQKSRPGDYITGSRALLTGKYVEDLPHLPRPANAPPVGARHRVKMKSRSPTRFFMLGN